MIASATILDSVTPQRREAKAEVKAKSPALVRAELVKSIMDGLRKAKAIKASGTSAGAHLGWDHRHQWKPAHPEGDPAGLPSGKIKHAVLVIGGKRYKGPSHFQAMMDHALKHPGHHLDIDSIQHEGFETESGHFLDRQQAADYHVTTKSVRRELGEFGLKSEDLHLAARSGQLYTQDRVQAEGRDTLPDDGALSATRQGQPGLSNPMTGRTTEQIPANFPSETIHARAESGTPLWNKVQYNLSLAVDKAVSIAESAFMAEVKRGKPVNVESVHDSMRARLGGAIENEYTSADARLSAEEGVEASPDQAAEFAIQREDALAGFIEHVTTALRDAIEAHASKAEGVRLIKQTVLDILNARGALVSETETQCIIGTAQMGVIKRSGYTEKTWVHMDDDRVRPTHRACGEQGKVPIDKPFSNGLMYPGDPSGPPEEICNCRCLLVRSGKRKEPVQASDNVSASHIKQYQRHTKSGEVVTVKEHEDKRQAAEQAFISRARSRGMVPIKRVGDSPKEVKTKHGVVTKMLGGKWVMESGEDVPEHVRTTPPQWRHAHIHPDPNAPYVATGLDEKGRAQSNQSESEKAKNAEAKFQRNNELMRKQDAIFAENDRNMTAPETAEVASLAKLIIETGIRPGSSDGTGGEVKSYGASTLEGRHVVEKGGKVFLKFVGKHGVDITRQIEDGETARMILERANKAGRNGKLLSASYSQLLDYVHTLDGGKFKPKDFRTLVATKTAKAEIDRLNMSPEERESLAATAELMLDKAKVPKEEKGRAAIIVVVAKKASEKLGNTWKVALQSYINPVVWRGLK
jgi:DNA topoisomerase I